MTKKQVMLVSIVAAIPGGFLLYLLVIGLLQGMLGDKATVSIVLWGVWSIALVGSIVATAFPFAIMLFPGLFPEAATAGAVAGSSASGAAAPPSRKSSKSRDEDDKEEDDEEEFEESEDEEAADEGEQLFDNDALDDDFDDEFEDDDDRK